MVTFGSGELVKNVVFGKIISMTWRFFEKVTFLAKLGNIGDSKKV